MRAFRHFSLIYKPQAAVNSFFVFPAYAWILITAHINQPRPDHRSPASRVGLSVCAGEIAGDAEQTLAPPLIEVVRSEIGCWLCHFIFPEQLSGLFDQGEARALWDLGDKLPRRPDPAIGLCPVAVGPGGRSVRHRSFLKKKKKC